MSLGVLLALTSTYLAFRPALQGSQQSDKSVKAGGVSSNADASQQARSDVLWSALIGSFYCVAGLSAIFYPGTDWFDPEYQPSGSINQGHLFGAQVILMWAGWWLEKRRLGRAKGKNA